MDEAGRLWCVDTLSNYQVATTIPNADTPADVQVSRNLNHKNLVRYICTRPSDDVDNENSKTLVFSELCSGGSIVKICDGLLDENDNPAPLSLEAAGAFVLQICSGLNYLHSKGGFHGGVGGVCAANIFLGRGNVAKIANWFPFCGQLGLLSEKEVSKRQANDLRGVANLTGQLLGEKGLHFKCIYKIKSNTASE